MQSEPQQPYVIERVPGGSTNSDSLASRFQQGQWTARGVAQLIAQSATQALAPSRCAGCGWFSPHLFCERCALRVRRVDKKASLCDCCGERFEAQAVIAPGTICAECRGEGGKIVTPIERARSLWMLSGPVQLAVHDFKYRRHTDLAGALGAHMTSFAQSDCVLSSAGLIVPVPLHRWREWRRGFNQSGLLAQHIARGMCLPCADILRRARHTPTQTTLARQARDANVRAAFQVRTREVAKYLQQGETGPVLLIDDVWTTGATLRECARVLQAAGFKRVFALTLARRSKGPVRSKSSA